MSLKSGASAPPHGETCGLTYGATKTQARGASARETPIRGLPNSTAPKDTGGRMPNGANIAGILGKPRSGRTT
jgi:hypothetical protein